MDFSVLSIDHNTVHLSRRPLILYSRLGVPLSGSPTASFQLTEVMDDFLRFPHWLSNSFKVNMGLFSGGRSCPLPPVVFTAAAVCQRNAPRLKGDCSVFKSISLLKQFIRNRVWPTSQTNNSIPRCWGLPLLVYSWNLHLYGTRQMSASSSPTRKLRWV